MSCLLSCGVGKVFFSITLPVALIKTKVDDSDAIFKAPTPVAPKKSTCLTVGDVAFAPVLLTTQPFIAPILNVVEPKTLNPVK